MSHHGRKTTVGTIAHCSSCKQEAHVQGPVDNDNRGHIGRQHRKCKNGKWVQGKAGSWQPPSKESNQ